MPTRRIIGCLSEAARDDKAVKSLAENLKAQRLNLIVFASLSSDDMTYCKIRTLNFARYLPYATLYLSFLKLKSISNFIQKETECLLEFFVRLRYFCAF